MRGWFRRLLTRHRPAGPRLSHAERLVFTGAITIARKS